MITQRRLQQVLNYDPGTGVFKWLVSAGRAAAGSRAGSANRAGYRRISIDGELEYEHRLAFVYMTGEYPPQVVDHINGDPSDNRWSNLRLATPSENGANRHVPVNNTSGYRGVHWFRQTEKWQAYGSINRKRVHLGYFNDVREAAAAAERWREQSFKEFSPRLAAC